jgi:predicted Holliday junction resolvase-like endonuclease
MCFSFRSICLLSHDKIAERKAESYLAKWKVKEEKAIREDAYSRSRAVSFGKTIEHYVPFMERFPVEPKDVQFFGKPIDYIAFQIEEVRKNVQFIL